MIRKITFEGLVIFVFIINLNRKGEINEYKRKHTTLHRYITS
jgi:hypothetical protein